MLPFLCGFERTILRQGRVRENTGGVVTGEVSASVHTSSCGKEKYRGDTCESTVKYTVWMMHQLIPVLTSRWSLSEENIL